ncbi:MAG: polysaccharide pyruvyl transferase family protein [Thiotrichaceae bacterium]
MDCQLSDFSCLCGIFTDQAGVGKCTAIIERRAKNLPITFVPDVAFVLNPVAPEHPIVAELQALKQQGKILIGLNISGLLYNGGAAADAKYQLQSSYRELVEHLIALLLRQENTVVMLVSHVHSIAPHVESDPYACEQVYEKLYETYPDRLLWLQEKFDHRGMKYVIGQCEFFLGSRMHACIGAISQAVPTIGLAYSGKFIGVFASAGVGETVVDLREHDILQVLALVETTFIQRHIIAQQLQVTVPPIKAKVIQLFDTIDF